jgi:phosphoglycolate phosphatase-like HAD superfamily hydrolase
MDVNYVKAKQLLAKEKAATPSASFPGRPSDIFDQISALIDDKKRKKVSSEKYDEFAGAISKAMEESEMEQVGHLTLYTGVKNGLASLKPMKLSVIGTTDIGTKAAEKFLREKEVDSFFSKVAARDDLVQAVDIAARLKPLLTDLDIKPEESIYFCNRMRDLKAAQVLALRPIVMPSRHEQIDALLRAKPEGMIISLEELPTMLSLKSFKGSDDEKDAGMQSEKVGHEVEGSASDDHGNES